MTDDLHRSLAPVGDRAWQLVEDEVRRHLETLLAARRVVDFAGPLGWGACCVPTGQTEPIPSPVDGAVGARLRRCQPMVELSASFSLERSQLDDVERGRRALELTPALEAAAHLALGEDRLVFSGSAPGGIVGIATATDVARLRLPEAPADVPATVARGINLLARRGIAGPWTLVLSPELHEALSETIGKSARPVTHELERVLGLELVRTAAVADAVLVSRRGGDFELTVGRDISIGFAEATATTVQLYLVESLTFTLLGPEAALVLARES